MHRTTVKITRHSVHILLIRDFSRQILRKKIFKIPNFVKIRPVGDQSFHADRRIDMTKLTVAFRKFTNAPKNGWCLYLLLFFYKTSPLTSQFSIVQHLPRKHCATEFLTHFYGHLMLPRLASWKLVNCGTEFHFWLSSPNITKYSKYVLTYTEVRLDVCLQALVQSQGQKQETKMDGQNEVWCCIQVYVHRRRGPARPPACAPYTGCPTRYRTRHFFNP